MHKPVVTLAPGLPRSPGVYFLLDRRQRLVYVGMAADLNRRLHAHARSGRWRQVGGYRYEMAGSVVSALLREADILAALRPRWNKAHIDDYFSYVTLAPSGLKLGASGSYGCFPHLGRGAVSEAGRACIDGFDALNRILKMSKVVKITGPSSELAHDFLAGQSDRLVRQPVDVDQPHVALGARKDQQAAARFYRAGPKAVRDLRLRHGGQGTVSREQFVTWVTQEVREMLRDRPDEAYK